MWLMELLLPVIAILALIIFKLNHKQKDWLFKVPILISSTVLSLLVAHVARGVMGIYGAFFCDLLLYPAMCGIKKIHGMQKGEVKAHIKEVIHIAPGKIKEKLANMKNAGKDFQAGMA